MIRNFESNKSFLTQAALNIVVDISTIENILAQVEVRSESHFKQFDSHNTNAERSVNNFNVK